MNNIKEKWNKFIELVEEPTKEMYFNLDPKFLEDYNELKSNIDSYIKVLDLITQFPEEVSFVIDSKNYAKYLKSYDCMDLSEVALTVKQFNILKDYFKDEEN